MSGKPCEYCDAPLPLGVDKATRRVRSSHFAHCASSPKNKNVTPVRPPVGYVVITGHGTHFREAISDEQRDMRFGGFPVWRPVYL